MSGFSMIFDPPIIDILDSPFLSVWRPMCSAVRPVEHPVSTMTLDPIRSKKCDIRFDIIAAPLPVRRDRGSVSGFRNMLS